MLLDKNTSNTIVDCQKLIVNASFFDSIYTKILKSYLKFARYFMEFRSRSSRGGFVMFSWFNLFAMIESLRFKDENDYEYEI